LKKTDSTLIGR